MEAVSRQANQAGQWTQISLVDLMYRTHVETVEEKELRRINRGARLQLKRSFPTVGKCFRDIKKLKESVSSKANFDKQERQLLVHYINHPDERVPIEMMKTLPFVTWKDQELLEELLKRVEGVTEIDGWNPLIDTFFARIYSSTTSRHIQDKTHLLRFFQNIDPVGQQETILQPFREGGKREEGMVRDLFKFKAWVIRKTLYSDAEVFPEDIREDLLQDPEFLNDLAHNSMCPPDLYYQVVESAAEHMQNNRIEYDKFHGVINALDDVKGEMPRSTFKKLVEFDRAVKEKDVIKTKAAQAPRLIRIYLAKAKIPYDTDFQVEGLDFLKEEGGPAVNTIVTFIADQKMTPEAATELVRRDSLYLDPVILNHGERVFQKRDFRDLLLKKEPHCGPAVQIFPFLTPEEWIRHFSWIRKNYAEAFLEYIERETFPGHLDLKDFLTQLLRHPERKTRLRAIEMLSRKQAMEDDTVGDAVLKPAVRLRS